MSKRHGGQSSVERVVEGQPDGTVQNWAVESGAPNALIRRGLRKEDFPLGVEVVVKGYMSKKEGHTADGASVTFADGRNFFTGSSGTGAPDPAQNR